METYKEYLNCNLCPRNCNIDRTKKPGVCGETSKLSINSALLHFGEEPPISFINGSGTIFFTGCSLRCPFCQNMQVSQNALNKNYYTQLQFVDMILNLINKGAENINFVTPDHFMPHIIDAIKAVKDRSFNIPFIYNCSGYQKIDHLEKIIDYIDIFLFDYKFADPDTSGYCVKLTDYPKIALNGLEYIYNKKGNLKLDKNGKAISGLIIRHLVLPDFIQNTFDVLNNLYFTVGSKVYISLMSQYSPLYLKNGYNRISRKVSRAEYDKAVELAFNLGFNNGYIQDYIDGEDEYIPDFDEKKMYDKW